MRMFVSIVIPTGDPERIVGCSHLPWMERHEYRSSKRIYGDASAHHFLARFWKHIETRRAGSHREMKPGRAMLAVVHAWSQLANPDMEL